jgi:hypothetical protein
MARIKTRRFYRTTYGEHVVFNEHVGYGGEDTREAINEHVGSDGRRHDDGQSRKPPVATCKTQPSGAMMKEERQNYSMYDITYCPLLSCYF